ncbi:MAG: hypothetical protein JXA18_15010 [Chitinispirillaceae bacterium]|nr:hypothetical protein [Chitinispirillaceae bacterium]
MDITSPEMSLTQIPVYIKANSIYPTGQVFAGLAKKWEPEFDGSRTMTINAFSGSAGESVSFTYIDYVDGDKEKVMELEVDDDDVITVSAPAMTLPGTVALRLPAAPTSVYRGSSQIAFPVYDAGANKLTVPFEANEPIMVTVNPTVEIVAPFEPVQAKGLITVRHNGTDRELVIPRMTGLDARGRAAVRIFSMTGREIVKKSVPLNRHASTPLKITTGKGVFLAKVSMHGISMGTVKIIIP